MSKAIDQIRKAILGRSPLIYLLSAEEQRLVQVLTDLAQEYGKGAWQVETWSCVHGLSGAGSGAGSAGDTRDPAAALQAILAADRPGVTVMRDLAPFMEDPRIVRGLREICHAARPDLDRFVVIVAPTLVMPETLRREVRLIDVPPPDEAEIAAEFLAIQAHYPQVKLPKPYHTEIVMALKGLALAEVDHTLHRIFRAGLTDKGQILTEIFDEKEMIVRKSGYLQFAPPRWDLAGVGGMGNLKDWLVRRKALFTREALASGVPMPKGLLVMGVSGCGKSLAVKVISSLWNVPMFRLDMNLVFSGLYGSPEAAFHNALQTIESVAPAVLWVDEIEGALGLEEGGGLRMASHIFSSFLTWMQEKPPMVFIAATANRIQALPAEIIRKGRFDQVFFVDLPTDAERMEILQIHLRRNQANPDDFDLKTLAVYMDGWNGAEIEQAVIGARVDAYADGRTFAMKDVTQNASKIVPLSDTMETQIKAIRDWAFTRATPASKFGKNRSRE